MARTMERVRSGMGLGLLVVALLLGACGDDDDNGSNNNTGDTGSDLPGGDTVGGDSTQSDAGECDQPNTQCFTPLPSAGTNPRLLFESVQFGPVDQVVLKNVSADELDMTGYFVCRNPTYEGFPDGFTLGSTGEVTLHLGVSGTNSDTELFFPDFPTLGAQDELAIFESDEFESSSAIVAYVRWGSPPAGFTRAPQASGAGLWGATAYVPVCGDNQGIIGVGDATQTGGFRDVPASCFD